MGQERLDSLSLLCIDADMLHSVDFEDVIKDFALAESRKRTFWIVYCIAIVNVCNRDVNNTVACESVNNIDALHSKRCTCNFARSKKLCILACKQDPMIRDRDETETFDFQSKTRSRLRPSATFPRDRDETKTFGNYVSRRRRRDRDYIPACTHYQKTGDTACAISNLFNDDVKHTTEL